MSEKEEFEKLPEAMPKWIKDHVELYLSDPERAHLWIRPLAADPARCRRFSSSRVERRAGSSAAAAPLPGDRWEVRRHRLEGRRADASGLVRESKGESGMRDPNRLEAHARAGADRERGRTNARLEEDGGDVSAVRRLPEASGFAADPGGGSRADWPRMNPRIIEAAG